MTKRITTFFVCLFCLNPAWGYDRTLWTSYPSMNYVTGLAESSQVIYVSTTGGIRRYDRFTQKWLPPLTMLDGLPNNQVQNIIFNVYAQELWFNTPSGSGRWLEGLQTTLLGGAPPQQPHQPRNTSQFSSLVPPFGYYLDNNRIIGPRQDFAITQTHLDNWNNLWIGTWGLGIGMANLNDRQLHFNTFGPIEENVTALAKDNNFLWVGGADTYRAPARGISRYNRQTQNWEYFESARIIGLENPQIKTILADSNTVWFGTHQGLTKYNKRGNRWLTYRDTERWGRINALAKDQHILWMGSERGLAFLNTRTDTLDHVSGSERAIIHTMITGPNAIWAGTETGLYTCRRGTRTWRAVSDPQKISKRIIRALTVQDSTLWIATEHPSALISHPTNSDTWQEYPLPEMGGSHNISLSANKKHVWVSTDQGAFLFDISQHHFTRYHTTEGLIHPRVQAIITDQNYVWFGTAEGLSRFHWERAFLE